MEFNDFLGLDQDDNDSTDEDPFEKFINGPRMAVRQYKDLVIFWTSEFANTGNEQSMSLARMAMDVLGCPGTFRSLNCKGPELIQRHFELNNFCQS